MKKVLITGGAGFIGSHTADALAAKGYAIRIMDNLGTPVHNGKWPAYVQGKGYELMKGDVRNRSAWSKALKGVEYVYHLAAYQDQRLDFSTFFETNTTSTALLYEEIVAKKLPIKKVIIASSQFVYGDGMYQCAHTGQKEAFYPDLRALKDLEQQKWDIECPHGKSAECIPFEENQPVHPTNSYGLSKHALEELAIRLGKTYKIPTTIFRYSIVQGERQSPRNLYSGALRIFVSQALAGVPITAYEDGNATRDFVNIHDVVRANLLGLTAKTDYEICNVGGDKPYTVLEFAKEVKRITKSNSTILLGSFRRTDTRHAISNVEKLKKYGWKPKYSIEDSITAYTKWFIEEGFLKTVNKKHLIRLQEGIKK